MIEKLIITNHAYERYAMRVRSAEDKLEVRELLLKYKSKYEEEIKKLYNSSSLFYTGQFGHNKENVSININNGGWVLITNDKDGTLITMYRPDLGLGDEFNKEFVKKSLLKITELKTDVDEKLNIALNTKMNLNNEIQSYENKIIEYKSLIDSLTKKVDALKTVKKTSDTDVQEASLIYKTALEDFCAKDKLKE